MEAHQERVPSLFIVTPVLFLVGLLLFVTLRHGHKELSILCFLVFSVGGCARVWSRLSLSGIRYTSRLEREKVFPGQKVILHVEVENAKFLPVWLRMSVPVDANHFFASGDRSFLRESGLLWYQRVLFQWELTPRRRGVPRVGPPRMKVGDLLGFFPREKEAQKFSHLIVYPRLVPLKSLSLPRHDFFGVPGAKSPVMDPVYMVGTRDYQQWQPARYIHWKATARHGRLQEKIFEPTGKEKVLLVVEVDQFEKGKEEAGFERTLEVAASVAVRLDRMGHAVGLATNGAVTGGGPAVVPVGRNPHQISAVLELLARLQMKSEEDILTVLRRGIRLPWGASCVHFSFEQGPTTLAVSNYLRRRKTPALFMVCRPLSHGIENGGEVRGNVHSLQDICREETIRP